MSAIEISQDTLSSLLEGSRTSLPPSPDQLLEAKCAKSSCLLLKRKSTIYDFSVNTASTSLNDLDCNDLANGRNSIPNSANSTTDCSRWNFESRVLTRNSTLESDMLGPKVYSRNQSLECDIASPEDDKTSNLCLGGDFRLREREVCPQILEHSDEEANDLSGEMSRRVLEEEEKLRTPKIVCRCQDVKLEFDVEGALASAYHFSNYNKTVVHKSNMKFSTIFANQMLPSQGKSRFSVRIEHANKTLSKLYVGIASGEVKDKPIAYKPGYYFISAFSKESYLNRLQVVKEEVLPRQGEIITVCVDMDSAKVWFEVQGKKILEGKISLSKTKANEFYPCIALGEAGGSVSFV